MAKDSFILYHSFYESIEHLSDEDIGKLTRAIFIYEIENKEIELSPVVKMAFSFIKKQLDINKGKWKETCEKRKEAGKQGGLKSGEVRRSKQSKCLKNEANEAEYVYVSEYDSVSDSENDLLTDSNYSEIEKKLNLILTRVSDQQYKELLAIYTNRLINNTEAAQKLNDILLQYDGWKANNMNIKNDFPVLRKWIINSFQPESQAAKSYKLKTNNLKVVPVAGSKYGGVDNGN
jgi:hypothetical protein